MLSLFHHITVLLFITAPIVALIFSVFGNGFASHKWQRLFIGTRRLGVTFAIGVLIACGITMVYLAAEGRGSRIPSGQTALMAYFAVSLILIVGAVDALLIIALNAIAKLIRGRVNTNRSPKLRRALAVTVPLVLRPAIMLAFAVPYVMASVAIYRPKIVRNNDPHSSLNTAFENASFNSTDGVHLAAWWIPGMTRGDHDSVARKLHQASTILICHGFGAGKADALRFAGAMQRDGYNVLLFDFRAHGQSDGQLTTFGNTERRDVLAAVDWVRQNHATAAQHIFGFGISTGAAALIEAATDDSDAGQSIDAIAVYEAFDSLDSLTRDLIAQRFSPSIGSFLQHFGLSLGAIQAGASLHDVAPASIVNKLWPRPIVVIHSVADEAIPFEHGLRLFEAADEPKRAVWLPITLPNQAAIDGAAVNAAIDFFDEARPIPAI